MSTSFETRTQIGGIICVFLGGYSWIKFVMGMTDGIEFSLDFSMLLLPVGISLLHAGTFWRIVTTILLAGLTLVLLLMTAVLIALDPQEIAGMLTSELPLSPAWIKAGMVLIQLLFIGVVVVVYYSMIEGKLTAGLGEGPLAHNGSDAT